MKRIGILNRGEAAVRFLAGLEGLSLESVAFYVDADGPDAAFVRRADHAWRLGVDRTAYLDAAAAVAGLKETGCDSAWLGWGFASEDGVFAQVLEDAGVTLLAPRPESMTLLGDKIRAKQIAELCEVPVAPWAIVESPAAAVLAAPGVGFPLLVKAAGGGGGRGIRRVDCLEEVEAAVVAARAEAARSFTSDGVMLELLVEGARHVEVQVFGDGEGNIATLGLRDCSLQRRRQKVIEECPAPAMPAARARALETAARRLCAHVNYRSAGTVEFLYDAEADRAYFLEVNTRLQVEHPVTEAVFGVDLVRAQIAQAIPEVHAPRGWAIEARICAEDVHAGFAPAPGRIVRFTPPTGPGLRIDTGFAEGDTVSPEFDALVAKLIAWGPDRRTAMARLARGLEETRIVIEGGTTNLSWLRSLLDLPAFCSGTHDVGLIDRLAPVVPPGGGVAALAAAIDRFLAEGDTAAGVDRHRVEAGESLEVYRTAPDCFHIVGDEGAVVVLRTVEGPLQVSLRVGDGRYRVERAPGDDLYLVNGVPHRVAAASGGNVTAPSASLVLALPVNPGQKVAAQTVVAIVESMKMEVYVLAPKGGTVREVRVAVGDQVQGGQVLVVMEPDADGETVRSTGLAGVPWDAPPPDEPVSRLVRGVIGWDREPGLVASDRADLARRDVRPLLAAFADVAELFERRSQNASDGSAVPVAPSVGIETLRQQGPDALDDTRREALGAALKHHGIDDLADAGPALSEALRRLERAGRALNQTIDTAVAALRALEGEPPVALLDRLAELDPSRFGPVREAAESTRYRLYERPAYERLSRLAELRAHVLLERLRTGRADWVDLAAAPESLVAGTAGPAVDGSPIAAEAMARRLEWQSGDPVVSFTLAGHLAFTVGEGDHACLVVTCRPIDARAVLEAARALDRRWLRFDLVVVNGGSAHEIVTEMERRLELGHADAPDAPWDMLWLLAITTERQQAVRCYRGLGAEIVALRDMLPSTAERIDLDRLVDFDFERLPGTDEVVLFKATAKSNPDDVRLLAYGEIRSLARSKGHPLHLPHVERVFHAAVRAVETARARLDPRRRMQWNRITLLVLPVVKLPLPALRTYVARLSPSALRAGLEKVVVRARLTEPDGGISPLTDLAIHRPVGRIEFETQPANRRPLRPHSAYETRLVAARRRGQAHPYEIINFLERGGPGVPPGVFTEYDIDAHQALNIVDRAPGENIASVVIGVHRARWPDETRTLTRVLVLSDPTQAMGALSEPECVRIMAALDLAEAMDVPLEWVAVSAGARIDWHTGTENLDWTARVLAQIIAFTQAGRQIDLIVPGICVGAQAYWNAEATMMMHTRGLLIMTEKGSMVLTGKRALDFSGCVSAEDDLALGGYTTIMGPNGQAQAYATDLVAAYRLLYRYHGLTLRTPGERRPPAMPTRDPVNRDIGLATYPSELGHGFETVGQIFSREHNAERKRPFAVRPIMTALMDADARPVERWAGLRDAETAVAWETRIGGYATTLIGIENRTVSRLGTPSDSGPRALAGGTLYPQAARKIARALNAASGRRPVVVVANLSGFDGSPESLALWQLEYGAEIGRAVVNFNGPIVFAVVSRYHGGAYVVFSKALNPGLTAVALEGSFASVIGGAPAAAVVFGRDVRKRAMAAGGGTSAMAKATAEVAAEFDGVHTVERARDVGSIDDIIAPAALRGYVIEVLAKDAAQP
jgi:acetyl/propionyl-CoA carboxylase alpha subunit/acetyl-CoA carboxylase carboxyltransferase component